jgi:hypothetical protein
VPNGKEHNGISPDRYGYSPEPTQFAPVPTGDRIDILTTCNPCRKRAIRKVIMTTRTFLAAILGGIAMFIWSFIAHDLLPLGEMGVREFKNEAAMLDALKTDLGDAGGLYHFPGHRAGPNATRQEKSEAMKRAMEKAASGPSGLLIYHPTREFTFGKLLGIEFATELFEAILVVFLLTQTRIESFGGRVGFILVAGILAAITTNIPYWNWYGFPSRYTAAYVSIEIIGFLYVGLVAALLLKSRSPASASR